MIKISNVNMEMPRKTATMTATWIKNADPSLIETLAMLMPFYSVEEYLGRINKAISAGNIGCLAPYNLYPFSTSFVFALDCARKENWPFGDTGNIYEVFFQSKHLYKFSHGISVLDDEIGKMNLGFIFRNKNHNDVFIVSNLEVKWERVEVENAEE